MGEDVLSHPQAAAEGVQTLLPVYVFDREKFNTPTLAGEESENSREKERERERERTLELLKLKDLQRLMCTWFEDANDVVLILGFLVLRCSQKQCSQGSLSLGKCAVPAAPP